MFAIYKRELRSYFITPLGYIFCGMFLLVSGILFYRTTLAAQSTESLSEYFLYLLMMFAVLIPLLASLLGWIQNSLTHGMAVSSTLLVQAAVALVYSAIMYVVSALIMDRYLSV